MLRSAAENEGVKLLLSELTTQIHTIDDILLTADSNQVNDYQRDRLLDQKKTLNRILSYFSDTDTKMQALESEFDKNL